MLKEISEENKRIILGLEQNYPVDKWVVNGIHIWPYVRIRLFIHYFKPKKDNLSFSDFKNSSKENNKKHFLRKIFLPFRVLKSAIVQERFFSRLNSKKIIFFGSHIHRSKQPEGYFNRFFDSMVAHHKLEDEVYAIEFQRVFKKNFNQKAIIPLHKHLNNYKLLNKVYSRFQAVKANAELQDYSNFLCELESIYPEVHSLKISEKELIHWTQKINAAKGFFSRMYRIVKPTKLVLASYYGFDDLSAAILAAHELGIKTIDFQHGPQMNFNMAYNSWTKVPEKLYNIMPVEYWTWDKDSTNTINNWARKTNGIMAKTVGQPYLSYSLKQKYFGNQIKKYILYSLQPAVQQTSLKDFFPEQLITLIKKSINPWVLRMHTRTNYNKDEVADYLNTLGLKEEEYTIEDSLESPLPHSLAQSIVHFTNWSGCLLEAKMMGVPSIIIHDFGRYLFRNYIDDYLVYYLDLKEVEYFKKYEIYISKILERNKINDTNKIINPLYI